MEVKRPINRDIFQSNIPVFRNILGITLRDLQEDTGFEPGTISAIETGRTKKMSTPTFETLLYYIEHLDDFMLSDYQKYWLELLGTKKLYSDGEKRQGQYIIKLKENVY